MKIPKLGDSTRAVGPFNLQIISTNQNDGRYLTYIELLEREEARIGRTIKLTETLDSIYNLPNKRGGDQTDMEKKTIADLMTISRGIQQTSAPNDPSAADRMKWLFGMAVDFVQYIEGEGGLTMSELGKFEKMCQDLLFRK